MKKVYSFLPAFVIVLLFTTSCVVQQSPITGTSRAYAYSWEQEKQIGQEVDQEIVAQFGLYDDEKIDEYVNNISNELLENSHMRREDTAEMFRETEFTFRVLDSPVINAFALPGGYVYVTRGLMAHMNNEAQLAMVLGHEIGHVAARHASQRGVQQTLGQVLVIGGAVLGQELLGLPGESILNLSSQAAQLVFLRYSREAERESDRLGVEYAAKTGYDSAEGAAFFTSLKRISERSGQAIPNLLSTHPDPGERENTIPRLAERWKEQGYDQNIRNQEEYLDMLDGLLYGENPRDGFVEENRFVHPDLEFQFPIPENWQVINQPSQVVLLNENNSAVMIMRIDGESSSARNSVQNFLEQGEYTASSQGEAQSGSGLTAYQAVFDVEQENERLRVHLYAVEHKDMIYRFINYTSQNQFSDIKPRFDETTANFDVLTDQRLLTIEPVRLSVQTVQNRQRFSDLLPAEMPMNIEPEEIAIINQVYLDDMIDAGTRIKLPVQ